MLSGAGSDSPNRRANAADGMHTRLTARLNELLAYKRWGPTDLRRLALLRLVQPRQTR
jgi:hypothetical protein